MHLTADMDITEELNPRGLAHVASNQERYPCLLVLRGSQTGRICRVESSQFRIGRDPKNDIILEDDGISRHHATIVVDGWGKARVVDKDSTNGTFCNGRRVDSQQLEAGDKIQLGSNTVLRFDWQDKQDAFFFDQQYHAVVRDDLTGCFNRRHFLELLNIEFRFARRHGGPLALLSFDLDHFKSINDTYGHAAGDAALQHVVSRVSETIRGSDSLARYGGDEFYVLMRETGVCAARDVAERLRYAVERTPFVWDGKRVPLQISIGASVLHEGKENDSVTPFLEQADAALYRAKKEGRNRVALSGPERRSEFHCGQNAADPQQRAWVSTADFVTARHPRRTQKV